MLSQFLAGLVDQAREMKEEEPNQCIIIIARKNKDKMNPEIIRRLVEMFNVKKFLDAQEAGLDLEQSFPLANAEDIIAQLFKEAMPSEKEASYVPILYDEPYLDLSMFQQPLAQKQASAKEDSLKSPIEGFLGSLDENFFKEMRFLAPKNDLLKKMGKDAGDIKIPDRVEQQHKVFLKLSEVAKNYVPGSSLPSTTKPKAPLQMAIPIKNKTLSKGPSSVQIKTTMPKDAEKKGKSKSPTFALTNEQLMALIQRQEKAAQSKKNKESLTDSLRLEDFGAGVAAIGKSLGDTSEKFIEKLTDTERFEMEPAEIPLLALGAVNPQLGFGLTKMMPSFRRRKDERKDVFFDNSMKLINNIQKHNVISSLLKDDPYLQNANANDMLNIYGILSDIAPLASSYKPVVAGILRNANAIGAKTIDPESMQQILKMEKLLNASQSNWTNISFKDDKD